MLVVRCHQCLPRRHHAEVQFERVRAEPVIPVFLGQIGEGELLLGADLGYDGRRARREVGPDAYGVAGWRWRTVGYGCEFSGKIWPGGYILALFPASSMLM